MKDILNALEKWYQRGERVALATVVSMAGSAPRRPGAKLAVSETGELAGSVSGGCVEPAVVEAALQVIKDDQPQLLEFGISEEDNIAQIGLACGGTIRVFVEPLLYHPTADPRNTLYTRLKEAITTAQGIATATIIDGSHLPDAKMLIYPDGTTYGTLGTATLDTSVQTDAVTAIWKNQPAISTHQFTQSTMPQPISIFIEGFPPPPELLIVGAGHIAIPLTTIAQTLHYHVTILDARSAFATRERFPHADEIIIDWPDEILQKRTITPSTAVVVLTHDPKFDEPALKVLLNSNAGYIGAIGSKTTQQERNTRLKSAGFSDTQIARIHGPIGLKIGAISPEEIALSIMAEIVAVQHTSNTAPILSHPIP